MTRTIENLERLAGVAEKFTGLVDKLPRFLEMFGVAVFAGRASKVLGGDFNAGALGGIVADGLAHSNLPHNQIGAIPLAAYFSAIGLINAFVEGDEDDTDKETIVRQMTAGECVAAGGRILDTGVAGTLFVRGEFIGRTDAVIMCELPAPPIIDVRPVFDFVELGVDPRLPTRRQRPFSPRGER